MRRVERSDFRLPVVITTSKIRVLRRPVESAQFTSTGFTDVLRDAKVKISPLGRLLRNRLPGNGWTAAAAGSTTG